MKPYEQVAVLEWIHERQRSGTPFFLGDSDLMSDFGLSVEQAQSILQALQARGEVDFRTLVLARGCTFTRIRLRRKGLERLQAAGVDTGPAPGRLGRVVLWLRS